MAPGVCGIYHDDAIYVSTAEALAGGQGYRLIDVPGAPLQTKYPWLYAAVLSIVWHFWPSFPDNVVVMQVVTLCFAAASAALAYLYLVRFGYCTRTVAAASVLICATASYFLYYAVLTMAEMPFVLFTLVALWGVEGFLLRPEMTKRAQFGWGCVLGLPFLCRTIGATVIVSSLWVLWRHKRPLRWYACGVAMAVLPWIVWSSLGRGVWDRNPVDGYYTDYVGCWSSTGLSMVGQVVWTNALMVAYGSAEQPLEGLAVFMEIWFGRAMTSALLMAAGLMVWLTMISDLRRGRALTWMLAVYLGAMLVWPWLPHRFLAPILPFLAVYLLLGWSSLLKRFSATPVLRFAPAMGLFVIVIANGALLACHAVQVRRTGYPLPKTKMAGVEWASYERTFEWLRRNSREEDVISSGVDSMMALYTNRQAVRPFVYDPGRLFYGERQTVEFAAEEVAGILRRYQPRYLVQSPLPGFAEEKSLEAAIEEIRRCYPEWLVVRYQDADPRFVVFEIDWNQGPPQEFDGGERQFPLSKQ
jgi:hypothetical protein